ncbi:unnamed protein product [Leptidea sinapis]|uniref:Uncharacterized protein n=1 Tax=Leptidea sinapis TaxID=189913 RepID=A0A5E4Q2H2_9NEOP|nr:unnamed protein product [Leptidea sinapis]
MLVCARQCARRKSLILTFGEFCVFAAELRRSEASPAPCEVFLGGSCNPTTWRSDIAIPMLNKMGITYFNPQVDDWSTELLEVEHRAKAEARALLFVLASETRAVAACVEAAHLAAAPRDLLLVLRPEYVELSRARATLQEVVERRGLPAFTDIPAALRCARAVLRGARTHPGHSLGHTILRLKRAYDAAGGRHGRLARPRAVDALKEATRSNDSKPEDILRREGLTYVIPRANDYTRMFSAPARRCAPDHPESPRRDKKPRPASPRSPAPADDVILRERAAEGQRAADRLSASDFYTVSEDVTPQPFKGTYDEDLLLGSRLLVFSLSSEAPNFSTMVLAAHYMGLRASSTLLIVQPMRPPAARVHDYSEAAVSDYNRGRHYLTDLARRAAVPVFDNVHDAMACVLDRLRPSV